MGRTSNKREEILRFLTQFVAENGYAPSVREICAAVGLQSTATVHYHLGALREAGLIEMDDMKKRAITLPDAHRADRIPVVGVVTAGVPRRTPLVTRTDCVSNGMVFLLAVMFAASSRSCICAPVRPRL